MSLSSKVVTRISFLQERVVRWAVQFCVSVGREGLRCTLKVNLTETQVVINRFSVFVAVFVVEIISRRWVGVVYVILAFVMYYKRSLLLTELTRHACKDVIIRVPCNSKVQLLPVIMSSSSLVSWWFLF